MAVPGSQVIQAFSFHKAVENLIVTISHSMDIVDITEMPSVQIVILDRKAPFTSQFISHGVFPGPTIKDTYLGVLVPLLLI
jgi:hypothetical protein